VFLFFIVFLICCIARLFFIQFFRANYLAGIARKQHNLFVELEPRRGTIYDANLKPQAVNISLDSLYASPSEIPDKDKENIIRQLSPLLNVDQAYLRDRLYRKKSFVWLVRKINSEQSQAIKRLNIKGLGFLKETKRTYPNSYLASHIIGFAGLDNIGLEGAEAYYDKYLKGEPGWALFLRDARQKKLDLWEEMLVPKDGYDLVLTIDEVIQYIAERELDKAFKTYRAKGASVVVMDPHTGAILALANRPTFDLDAHANVNKDAMRNRAICDLFEPGSVFKIVTASAALEEKKVSEEDKFFCENGSYKVATHILHDHRPHGWLTFKEVIEESSNIGTTKVAQILGPEIIYRYVKLFGFGEKSGIDLPGEIQGMIKEPRFWSKISIGAIPIGQEVGVTALQLVSAISVIANGGQLMRPYSTREIKDKYGETIKNFFPVMIRKVISLDTSLRVKEILKGAVENGTGKLARVSGFSAAGKTGTAQKLEANGTYSHDKFVASFIGFAPTEDPLIAIAVVVDEPRPYYFGGVVAAPVFKNIAADTLRYLKTNKTHNEILVLNETKTVN
jgi:cell division protein FtsI (penicillin-binding protein 3)